MRMMAMPLGAVLILFLMAVVLFPLANPSLAQASDDHGDYRSLATAVDTSGGQVSGAIDQTESGFDVDYFSFKTRRGVRYTFTLDLGTVQSANLAVVNSLDRGIGSSEGQFAYQDTDKKMVDWIARTADTYFVEVSAARDALSGQVYLGTYTLNVNSDNSLLDLHSDIRGGATLVGFGNQYQGAISPWSNQPDLNGTVHGSDDQDYFAFQAERGVKYTIDVDLGTATGLAISVRNSAGVTQTSNDGVGASLAWISPATNRYFVLISGTGRVRDPVGTYGIKVSADTSLVDRHSDNRDGATAISFGNAHQGAVSPSDDQDFFSFQTKRGVKYKIEMEAGTAEAVDIAVHQPTEGMEVSNGGIGASLDWIAPAGGSYFIVISASSQVRRVIGSYTLRVTADNSLQDRHSETRGDATAMNFGSAVAGAISPQDDEDYFSFLAKRGVQYTVEAELGTSEALEIAVARPGEGTETSNGGLGLTLDWIAPNDDTYFIVVSGPNQTLKAVGSYSVKLLADNSLLDRHSESRDEATPINFGNATAGAVSPPRDRDFFSFSAHRGVKYDIQVDLGTIQSVSIIVARTGQGTEATSDGISKHLVWIAPDDGTYFIDISASAQIREAVGTYSIKIDADTTLADRHGETPGNATSIGFGNAVAGAVSPIDDLDYFSFSARRGVKYNIALAYGTVGTVSLAVEDKAPSSRVVANNYGEGTDVNWIAPANATYYIVVSKSSRLNNAIGTYALKMNSEPALEDRHSDNPAGATQIGFGNAISGAVSPVDDYDYFSFPAERNESYTLGVDLGTAEAVRFSVINYAKGFTESNYGVGTSLRWTAPTTDTYIVVVSAADQAEDPIGTYKVTMKRGILPLPVAPLPTAVPTPVPTPSPTPQPTVTPTPGPPLPTPVPTPAPTGAALVVESRSASPGVVVLVPIRLENAGEVGSLGFNLNYDPVVLEVVKVHRGSRMSSSAFSYNAEASGVVRFGTAASREVRADGSAAVVEFKVIGTRGNSSLLTLSGSEVGDSNGNARSIQLAHGKLIVEEPVTGDGNGDGKITSLDALIALRMFVGLTGEDLVMDVNGDGRVTPEDARQLLSMARRG